MGAPVVRAKVGVLELAKQLGSVSKACTMMGYSRDSFYRFTELYKKCSELALQEICRSKPIVMKARLRALEAKVAHARLSDPVNLIWSERAPMAQLAKIFLAFVRSQIKLEFGAERKAASA